MTECRICGWKRDNRYVWGKHDRSLCWCCDFWQPFLRARTGLRYHGVHYTVAGDCESNTSGMLGHRWEFSLHDGRVIIFRNVTCQGTIPERFCSVLPDNVLRLRTTWRGDDVPEGHGWGNVQPIEYEPPPVVEPVKKLAQVSLFELL